MLLRGFEFGESIALHQSSGDDEIRRDVGRFVGVLSTRMEAVLKIWEMGHSLHILRCYLHMILQTSPIAADF